MNVHVVCGVFHSLRAHWKFNITGRAILIGWNLKKSSSLNGLGRLDCDILGMFNRSPYTNFEILVLFKKKQIEHEWSFDSHLQSWHFYMWDGSTYTSLSNNLLIYKNANLMSNTESWKYLVYRIFKPLCFHKNHSTDTILLVVHFLYKYT
jgi:hypothetical protein